MATKHLSNNEYFIAFPEKVLGELVTHSPSTGKVLTGPYGNPKPEVRGDLVEGLKAIKVPEKIAFDHLGSHQEDEVQSMGNYEASLNASKALSKTKGDPSKPNKRLNLKDSITKYNPDLSEEEIQAWITHHVNEGLYDPQIISNNAWGAYYIEEPDLEAWNEKGIVVFDGQRYVPSQIFYSGNIYQKIEDFKSKKEVIVQEIGLETFNKVLKQLEASKPRILRITSPGNYKDKLIISPFDKFLKHFQITELVSGKEFDKPTDLVQAFNWEYLSNLEPEAFVDGKIQSSAYDIRNYWTGSSRFPNGTSAVEKTTIKRNSQHIGKKLFDQFLSEGITQVDRNRIQGHWNSRFNCIRDFDSGKVPVGFEISTTFKGGPLVMRPAQREGVAFLAKNRTGIIAYDVGVGKTMTGIVALEDGFKKGLFKRPLVVVPNPTYEKWIGETIGVKAEKAVRKNGKVIHKKGEIVAKGILPQYQVNDYYNLGTKHLAKAKNEKGETTKVAPYSITFVTYEGLMKFGFDEIVEKELVENIKAILGQADSLNPREAALLEEAVYQKIDKALENAEVDISEMGIDAILTDEAHNFKNLFHAVKGEMDSESASRDKSPYMLTGSPPSARAIKLFMVSRFIQLKNKFGNTYGLTATPFTNSPLEIFSMLSHFDYRGIKKQGVESIKSFFDKFINESIEPTWTAKGRFEARPVIRSFNNLTAMQDMIFRSIIYKTGEEANISRPVKVVIPLRRDASGNELQHKYKVPSELTPTPAQQYWFKEIALFASGQDSEVARFYPTENDPDMNGRVMWAIAMNQMMTLSPFMTPFVDKEGLTPGKFLASSPKFTYVINCLKTIRNYHFELNEKPSGVVIYSNRGTEFFPLLREYIIESIGYKESEVKIIDGKTSKAQKEKIKKGFLDGDVQVLIGSATIEEGIDLQKRSSVLFNCFLQWNPTQLKQLEGRIWRFGNKYSHVRIVIPLMENSVDVFMWQKLSEKTDRINTIWQRAGRMTVLKLEELNPEELKFALITDPMELTRMEIQEKIAGLKADEVLYQGYVDQLTKAKATIASSHEKLDELKQISRLADDRSNYIWGSEGDKDHERVSKMEVKADDLKSLFRKIRAYGKTKQGWSQRYQILEKVDYFIKRQSSLERLEKNVLRKNQLTLQDDLNPALEKYQSELERVNNEITEVQSETNFQNVLSRILEEQEKRRAESGSIKDRVKAFQRLNFLLECDSNSGNTCSIYGIKRVNNKPIVKAIPKAKNIQAKEVKSNPASEKPKPISKKSARSKAAVAALKLLKLKLQLMEI